MLSPTQSHTTTDRLKSQCCCQLLAKLLEKCGIIGTVNTKQIIQQIMAAKLRVTAAKLTLQFGFIANPAYSMNNNVSLKLLHCPVLVLSSHPNNSVCHNLCTHSSLSKTFKALLGLGTKFCVCTKYTTTQQQFWYTQSCFQHDLFTQMYFAHD